MSQPTAARVPAPSAQQARVETERLGELWFGGMFLKPEAYTYQRDRKNPFAHGLLFIVVIGVLVALALILGAGLRYAAEPSADAIHAVVLARLQALPFYTNAPQTFQSAFDRGYNQVWDRFGSFLVGYPTNTASFVQLIGRILTTPLSFVLSWLVYGALVWLVARRWNPTTTFGQLLGALSLATAPQLLRVLDIFPNVTISTTVVWLWSWILGVVAIKAAFRTTTRRAVWGAIFPLLVYLALAILIGVILLAVLIPVVRSIGGGQ